METGLITSEINTIKGEITAVQGKLVTIKWQLKMTTDSAERASLLQDRCELRKQMRNLQTHYRAVLSSSPYARVHLDRWGF